MGACVLVDGRGAGGRWRVHGHVSGMLKKLRWDPSRRTDLQELEHSEEVILHVLNCSCSRTEEKASPGHRLLPTLGK